MPKPTGIRTATWLLYINLAFSLIVLVLNLKLLLAPSPEQRIKIDQLTSGQLTAAFISMLLPIAASFLTLWFIRRKKRIPAMVSSLAVLYFSSGNIYQMVLGLVLVFLLFLRSSKEFFTGNADTGVPAKQAPAAKPDFADPAVKPEPAQPLLQSAARPKTDPVVEIRQAGTQDAEVIHSLMLAAFEKLRAAIPPSSALEETVESVRTALEGGQGAAVLYEDGQPAAMVRYETGGETITFFRLSVLPARRRRGYARSLIKWIERLGIGQGLQVSRCKVRLTVQNNIAMYQDMGYEIVDQELVVRPAGSVKSLTMEKKLGI